MSKKTATVGVVLLVAIVAFGLAYVVAGMVGTYSINLFNEDNSTELLNNTTVNEDIPVYQDSQQSDNANYNNNVKTEDTYVSDSSSSGSSSSSSSSNEEDTPSGSNEGEDFYSN